MSRDVREFTERPSEQKGRYGVLDGGGKLNKESMAKKTWDWHQHVPYPIPLPSPDC